MIYNIINNAVEVLKKIGNIKINLNANKSSINLTSEKKERGIGFSKISGIFKITSKINEGTKIILNFIKNEKLSLIIDKIEINKNDTIIILDDDIYIHKAWKMRFKEKSPNMLLKCFEFANEAIDYIENLSIEEKEKSLFLVDYELSNQTINGLEVAEKVNLPRCVLVTNHFCNKEIEKKLIQLDMQMLEKLNISKIPINLQS